MPEPDLDSVSGLDKGKFTYDNHDDLVRDVRDFVPRSQHPPPSKIRHPMLRHSTLPIAFARPRIVILAEHPRARPRLS